jgi:hypothetical protein
MQHYHLVEAQRRQHPYVLAVLGIGGANEQLLYVAKNQARVGSEKEPA